MSSYHQGISHRLHQGAMHLHRQGDGEVGLQELQNQDRAHHQGRGQLCQVECVSHIISLFFFLFEINIFKIDRFTSFYLKRKLQWQFEVPTLYKLCLVPCGST